MRRLRSLFVHDGVRATAITRIIALGGAPVSIYLVATHLAPRVQGYYFVAINLIALAQLFEVGLGTIIVQFVSYEWPRLRWGEGGGLEGDAEARTAVHVVLRTALHWYAVAALVLFAIAGGGGVLLYSTRYSDSPATFAAAWCSFVGLTAIYLLVIPCLAVAEGCGDLLAVQRMRSLQALTLLASLWTGLLSADPLAAAILGAAGQLLIAVAWLWMRHPALLQLARRVPSDVGRTAGGLAGRFRVEQWRSAQLWLSLWLTPQLLTPVVLRLYGGDEAGRLGVTLAIALAPLSLAAAWLHGRYPSFGSLVAEGRLAEFDALARRATVESVAVFLLGSMVLTVAVMLLPAVLPAIATRVLPLGILLALFGGALASLVLQAMAGWLRAFRDDSVAGRIALGAAATVILSGVAAALSGVPAMTAVFAAASVGVAVPLAAAHFFRVRRQRLR